MMVVMTTDIHRAIFYEVIVAESIAKIEGPLCFHYSHTVASNSQSSTAVVESSDDVTSPFQNPRGIAHAGIMADSRLVISCLRSYPRNS
jgi:hypothetical protein